MLDTLTANSIFNVLDQHNVRRVPVQLDKPLKIAGLTTEAFAVPGKVALYLEEAAPDLGTREGDTIGLKVSNPDGAAFFYSQGAQRSIETLCERLQGASLVLFDGTLFTMTR